MIPLLVPRRADHGQRDRLWRHCRPIWEQAGFEVFEGDHGDDGPFRRSAAINLAAATAGAWAVAVVADADVILADIGQATRAAQRATQTGHLTYAHDHQSMLEQEQTELVLEQGLPPFEVAAGLTRHPNTWSQAFAVPRALWDTVGGFDERFVGWGWEDLSFMAACRTLAGGFSRIPGDVFHLWHPRSWEENEGGPHHSANHVLGQRYLDAIGNRSAMLALLAERALPQSS